METRKPKRGREDQPTTAGRPEQLPPLEEEEAKGKWEEIADDCCKRYRDYPPSVKAVISIAANARSFSVVFTATHRCGIRSLYFLIRLTNLSDANDVWRLDRDPMQFSCDPAANLNKRFNFGVAHPLPTPNANLLGWEIKVSGFVTSCCSDYKDFASYAAIV